jgi:hypothetical protein
MVATGALSVAGMSGTAHADKGLTVDPHSPAGVEYAVPLDSGRGHGGGSGSGGGGSRPLFGAGITPPAHGGQGTSGSSPGGTPSARNGHHRGGASNHSSSRPRASSAAAPDPTATPVRAAADYSSAGPVAGLIAAIVLAGGCLGAFLRFRTRRASRSGALE